MNELTNILYWISTGLLIPVVVALLILFVQVLILAGGGISQFINRLKYESVIENWLSLDDKESIHPDIKKFNPFIFPYIEKIIESQALESALEKIAGDFEVASDKSLAKVKIASRIGPMLGLMGTLIPMGPALVGLATGDIANMAQNMQVAFTTTVVGIVIGGIGFVLQLLKTRWAVQDLNTIDFLVREKLEKSALTQKVLQAL